MGACASAGVPRVANARPEKAFDGTYFAIVESIILGIAYGFVISRSYIINGKCIVTMNNYFRKLDFLKEFASRKTFLFESRQGNMIISGRAAECKIIGKLAGNYVPIFLFKSLKVSPDKFLIMLSYGRNGYAAKRDRKYKESHKEFYERQTSFGFPYKMLFFFRRCFISRSSGTGEVGG